MRSGIDIDDVDAFDRVEVFFLRQARIGVDHAGVEAHTEDRRDARLLAGLALLPFVVAVPGRRFANLPGILVNRGVHVGGAGLDAGVQHRHVHEGRPHVYHDLRTGLADQIGDGGGIHRVHGMRREGTGHLHGAFFLNACDDGVAFRFRAARDMQIAQHIIVLRAFVGHDLRDAACTDDKHVLFHFGCLLVPRGQWKGSV